MKQSIAKLLYAIPALLGLVLMLTPYKIAPVCSGLIELKSGNMAFMKCHYTAQAELLLGALLLCVGMMILLPKIEKRWLGAVIALIGLCTIIVPQPWCIGICANNMQECHNSLRWFYGEGLLTIGMGLGIWSKLIKDR